MIRTKGEAGTGDIVQAVRHVRGIAEEIEALKNCTDSELEKKAIEMKVTLDLVRTVRDLGRLPMVTFAAGGVATPADAAMMMQLGMDGVFVGSGIFKSSDPEKRARAIVEAVTHFNNPKRIAKVSEGLGEPMVGVNAEELQVKMEERGK
jgi:pyridoxal 5'-phosphate synthase pdxS subunit